MTQFSMVIPALNEEKYLPNLLESLTRQSHRDFDVVVVDGSSKDQTVALARSFSDRLPKLQVHVSDKASLPLQRNVGARLSEGKWLVFADADGALLPYALDRLACFIAQQQPQMFTAWFRPDSEVPGDALFTLLTNLFVEGGILLNRPNVPGPLTVVRRDLFEQVGGYDEALTFGEDYDLTRRLAERGAKPRILRETLAVWSLRRVRKEGKARFIRFYARAALKVLLTRRSLDHAPSYVMGGQFYETKRQ